MENWHNRTRWEKIKDAASEISAFAWGLGLFVAFPLAYIVRMLATPDMNGDGLFTISDFWSGIWKTWSYVGEGLMDLIGYEPLWHFLEINRADLSNSFLFMVICFVGWWMWGLLVTAVFFFLEWGEPREGRH